MGSQQKKIITLASIAIVILTLIALVPLIYSLVVGAGVKTEGVNAQGAKEATTDVNGEWSVVQGSARNYTSVGFTFDEVLPAERTTTSGSTTNVTGAAKISGEVVEQANVAVDMEMLTTDKTVRDRSMKDKLFKTAEFPQATFELTEPVDFTGVPADGTLSTVELSGDLTIKGKTQPVTGTFDVLRDGKYLVIGGSLPINRLDFDVVTPEFIAAKIAEEGELNIRLSFVKE